MKLLYKKEGETPLEALEQLREDQPELEDERLSYAGRLDPMAEGLLPILVGEENDNRQKYLGLDKEYAFEVLVGVQTDTFDILGIAQEVCDIPDIQESKVNEICEQLIGERKMRYPPFSSKTVDGTPLWKLAREGKLDEVEIPQQTVTIYDLSYENKRDITGKELKEQVAERITNVSGDFRQKQAIATWRGALMGKESKAFPILSFTLSCASGTYVRRIAEWMGEELGSCALAWHIKRTRVGDHTLADI